MVIFPPYGGRVDYAASRLATASRSWLTEADVAEGGRWGHVGVDRLSDRVVARIVKKHVAAIGLNAGAYEAHSLRSRLATSAARSGRSERAIMNQTGHRSVEMVRRYIRQESLFHDNAAAGLL